MERREPYTLEEKYGAELNVTWRQLFFMAWEHVEELAEENERLHHQLMIATTTIALMHEHEKEAKV